ncbi:MAG: arylsulfatase [Akkermansiaceae bacterium]|jgi:arylsulfatase A|nr:arylsulfatase [Akkermansiaceae bacterium]
MFRKSALGFGLLLALLPAKGAEAEPPMNVLLIYADDLGYGDLTCYQPDSKIPTPALDRLAAEGLRFTDAHSSSGVCTPSRYAMLTGRHHWRDFHWIDTGFDKPFFKPGQLTLQAMLQKEGYSTACIGKWHLGWNWDSIRKPGAAKNAKTHDAFDWSKPFRGGPLDQGFDHYFGDNVINFPPYTWIEDDRVLAAPDMTFKKTPQATKEGNWECREGPGRSDWDFYQVLPELTRKGVDYLRSRKNESQPFFLYFALPSPHAPIIPNDEFDGRSKAGAYGDFVVQTDDVCGRLLDTLKETGLDQRTIVIFSADNGPEIYAYPRDQKYDHWSAAPLRGLKRDIYEGGHRVPTMIRWPGVTRAGEVSDALFAQIDLMATLASYLDFQLPDDSAEDSHDFLPYLRGETPQGPRTTMVHNTFKDQYAIRDGDWVLIHAKSGASRPEPAAWLKKHRVPTDGQTPVALYNLREDLGQRHNLADKHPDIVTRLSSLLKKIRNQGHSAPRLASP